jgi:hypothetical protein
MTMVTKNLTNSAAPRTRKRSMCRLSAGVLALLLVLGLAPGNGAGASTASVEGSRVRPYELIFVGWTKSDAPHRTELLDALRGRILPGAARRRARVVVAITSGATSTLPQIAAEVDLDTRGQAQGNPVLRDQLVSERVDEVVEEVKAVLESTRPASSSDWMGALRLAAQMRLQYSARARTYVVLVGDALNAQPGCALDAEDLKPTGRDAVLNGCFQGNAPDLEGLRVAFAGAGVGRDLSAEKAADLESWYRWALKRLGAEVTCYAAVLIADCTAGRR